MDAVQQFATLAREFRAWVLHGTDNGPDAARTALRHVTRLYTAALELPHGSVGDREDPEVSPVPSWNELHQALRQRLPLGFYGEVFNPLVVPIEEPVIGDVADDLADIFSDLEKGLLWFEAGHSSEAVWEWRFGLVHHWGDHATGAMRALHWWLVTEHPDLLTGTTLPRSGDGR